MPCEAQELEQVAKAADLAASTEALRKLEHALDELRPELIHLHQASSGS